MATRIKSISSGIKIFSSRIILESAAWEDLERSVRKSRVGDKMREI